MGHYAADGQRLASSIDSAPLHALKNGASGGDGVYAHGSSATITQ